MASYAGLANRDYVHMLIGMPLSLSVSRVAQFLKGKSSAQAAVGVFVAREEMLRATFAGKRILGCF